MFSLLIQIPLTQIKKNGYFQNMLNEFRFLSNVFTSCIQVIWSRENESKVSVFSFTIFTAWCNTPFQNWLLTNGGGVFTVNHNLWVFLLLFSFLKAFPEFPTLLSSDIYAGCQILDTSYKQKKSKYILKITLYRYYWRTELTKSKLSFCFPLRI